MKQLQLTTTGLEPWAGRLRAPPQLQFSARQPAQRNADFNGALMRALEVFHSLLTRALFHRVYDSERFGATCTRRGNARNAAGVKIKKGAVGGWRNRERHGSHG